MMIYNNRVQENEKREHTQEFSKRGGGRSARPLRWIALAVAGALTLGALTLFAAPLKPANAAVASLSQPGLNNAQVRVAETEAGNIVADAIRAVAGAEVAFVPAAAFKAGASAPPSATAEQVATLLEPSSDLIVVLPVRGDRVLAALERAVSFAPQPSAGFLQISGIRFAYDPRKESQSRVSNVTVAGQPLAATRVYKVAMPRPLSIGQQGYFQVWDRDAKPTDTGKSLAQALSEYAQSRGGSLFAETGDRILLVK